MKKLILPILLIGNFCFGQITNSGTIYSSNLATSNVIPSLNMPSFDLNILIEEDQINDQLVTKPYRFGKEFDVNISPETDGKWSTLPNGDRVWQLKVQSKNAQTLNFLFKNYKLSPQAKLYFYTENQEFLGNYTAANNIKHKEVITWPIDGSSVIVEFYEPQAERGLSTFEIKKVIHGYRSASLTKGLNDSGHCNVDVNCAAGDEWELQKKAVALILSGNSSICTGTLVNNTANDGTPYFLTANHCYGNSTPAWSFRFNWISDQPDCATTEPSTDGPRTYTLSGAELMARNASTDFMLLRLNNSIPLEWDLALAGWDRSNEAPTNVTGLHHPSGDIMKIAQYYGPTTAGTRYSVQNWEIPAWDLGVTEGGSSGSALFNSQGYLIGQLYGGLAACSGLENNGRYDVYGRFDLSWEGGGLANNQLKTWLDPENLNPNQIEPYRLTSLVNDSRIVRVEVDSSCSTNVTPSVVINNNGLSTLSNLSLRYQYNNEGENILTIAQPLAANETRTIPLPEVDLPEGANNLRVELISELDDNLSNNLKNKSIEIPRSLDTQKVILTLTTDNYADETAWTLKNSANQIVYQSEILEDATTYVIELDQLTNDCYSFEITDSYDDGICCSYGNGYYSLTLEDGTILKEGGQFDSSEVTNFRIETNLGTSLVEAKDISIHPNPTRDQITLSIPTSYGNYTYEIYSTIGQKVKNGEGLGDKKLNLKSLGKGTFVVKIKTEKGKSISKKIIIQ